MSKTFVGLGIVGALLLAVMFALIGANNTANRYENDIMGQYQQSENVLGQYAPKLGEAIGVTNLQKNAVIEAFQKANESRYGADGSKATMQWIQEQNPNLDQGSYRQVLNIVEAGRNDFMNAQKVKVDQVRAYRTALGNFPGGFLMKLIGYPSTQEDGKSFFDKYGQVVVSDHAAGAFTTNRDNGVDINAMSK